MLVAFARGVRLALARLSEGAPELRALCVYAWGAFALVRSARGRSHDLLEGARALSREKKKLHLSELAGGTPNYPMP